MDNRPLKTILVDLFPVLESLELENWRPFYNLISENGGINVLTLQDVVSSQMARSDKIKILNFFDNLVTPSDFLALQDRLPPEILQNLFDKVMVDRHLFDDPVLFDLALRTAFKLDDIDNLYILFEIHPDPKWVPEQYLPEVRSVDALELIESKKPVKDLKALILKTAEIAPLDYFKKVVSAHHLDLMEFSNELLLHAIKGDELSIVKYLVEVHDVDVTSESLLSAIYYGSASIVDYFVHVKPDIFTMRALIALSDNQKYRVNPGNFEESVEFYRRRVETLKALLKSPKIDPSFDGSKVLKIIYPKMVRGGGDMTSLAISERPSGLLMTDEIDHEITEYLIILLSDPRVDPMVGIREASINLNEHALRVLLQDYRVSATDMTIKLLEGNIGYFEHLPILQELRNARKEELWTFREINSLQDMTYYEKYQLFDDLNSKDQVDPLSAQLLRNPNFQVAYLSSNEELATLLNDQDIPAFPNTSHGAAAVLYAGDIKNFKLLVPKATYEEYKRIT